MSVTELHSEAPEAVASERYLGLIRTAQELFDTHEESGWRLANVIYDAVEELRQLGFVIDDPRDRLRLTGTKRIALDMRRSRLGPASVQRYYYLWKRFGDADKRFPDLTFGDHATLNIRGSGGSDPAALKAIRDRRADLNAGRKPKYASANSALTAARHGDTQARQLEGIQNFSGAKTWLRRILKSNVWDYPDRQKVLDHIADLRSLLDEVERKFNGGGE